MRQMSGRNSGSRHPGSHLCESTSCARQAAGAFACVRPGTSLRGAKTWCAAIGPGPRSCGEAPGAPCISHGGAQILEPTPLCDLGWAACATYDVCRTSRAAGPESAERDRDVREPSGRWFPARRTNRPSADDGYMPSISIPAGQHRSMRLRSPGARDLREAVCLADPVLEWGELLGSRMAAGRTVLHSRRGPVRSRTPTQGR